MRKLTKLDEPEVLAENKTEWLKAFQADPKNKTNRVRYRHRAIKSQAKRETWSKCAYCESKVGHNTPGDIEHKVPTSVDDKRHFEWKNLTIACGECNRRKNDYFSELRPFLDPYVDDVDECVVHYGPVVSWKAGHKIAEISVKILELHNKQRLDLILRKVDRLNDIDERIGRYMSELDPVLKEIQEREIRGMQEPSEEYSGMLRTVVSASLP